MNNLFEFIQTSLVGGDCTCNYRIKFNIECTVREFLHEIFAYRTNEWGTIDVNPNICVNGVPTDTISTYYENCTIQTSFSEDVLNSIITEAVASGGYTRMDYILYVKSEINSTPTEPPISNSKDVIISDERVVYSKWKINCDGYYPYCAYCGEEPKGGMSKYCPNCGAKMCLED